MSRRRAKESQAEPRRDSARAVAWGAMFFAFLSFLVSITTFALTYKDGVMIKNFGVLSRDAIESWDKVRTRIGEARDAEKLEQLKGEQTERIDRLKARIERLAQMAGDGDARAPYYLENLKADLGMLREYSSEKSSEALGSMTESLEKIRGELAENGPAAASRLRELGGSLGDLFEAASKFRPSGEAELAAPENAPEPEPEPENEPESAP